MANNVLFKFGTRAEYDAIKDSALDNALYFLTDTGELLKGQTNLAQGHYYEAELNLETNETHPAAIARAVGTNALVKNDICIIRSLISADNYSHTAYVYDGQVWRAMDGNYNAENVYFDQDLIFTKEVGYVTLNNGQATVPAAGKNVKELLNTIFSQEVDPVVTQPNLTLETLQNTAWEVGTTITPTYTLSFNPGTYSYGPATGVNVTYAVTDGSGTTRTAYKDAFPALVIKDDTNYVITATASYTEGAIPVTNLQNPRANLRIAAGTKTETSGALTGYRAFFYGATSVDEISGTTIRNYLINAGKPTAQTLEQYEASTVPGAKKVIVALPVTCGLAVTNVIMPVSCGVNITSEFKKLPQTIEVGGTENYATTVPYNVWVYEPAVLDPKENYIITIG